MTSSVNPKVKIAILTFDGFTDADLFLHWDLLNRVRLMSLHNCWDVKILGTKESHLSVSGLKVETHGKVDEVEDCDAVLFTSGVGTRDLVSDSVYLERLAIDAEKQILAGQCSGSLILGAKGIIRKRSVSAYPPIKKLLLDYGANLVEQSLVVDENLATASSCLGSVLLSSWLIGKLAGVEAKQEVLRTVMPISGFSGLVL